MCYIVFPMTIIMQKQQNIFQFLIGRHEQFVKYEKDGINKFPENWTQENLMILLYGLNEFGLNYN